MISFAQEILHVGQLQEPADLAVEAVDPVRRHRGEDASLYNTGMVALRRTD
ncbi:MAG: hypothetical protein H0T52_04605 [Lautropia sp.]|nr:hypothetical protein [Lautropia sp.]